MVSIDRLICHIPEGRVHSGKTSLNPHEVVSLPPTRRVTSRRKVLKYLLAAPPAAAAVRLGQIFDTVHPGQTDNLHPLHQRRVKLSENGAQRTTLIAIGDSVAEGIGRYDEPPKSAAEIVVERVNLDRNRNWEFGILAKNGALIAETVEQVDEVLPTAKGAEDVGLIVSVGGNHWVNYATENRDRLARLYESPWLIFTEPIDQDIRQQTQLITEEFADTLLPRLGILQEELADQGTTLGHITFIDIPNIGDSQGTPSEIQKFASTTSETTESIDTQLAQLVTSGVTYGTNQAMAREVQRAGRKWQAGALMLPTSTITSEFNGIHPSRAGQEEIATMLMQRLVLPTEQTVFDLWNQQGRH